MVLASPVLIAAGVGLVLFTPIVLVSVYQFLTEPYLQIAQAAKKLLDASEEAQCQGLSFNKEYQQLEELFKQLLAHRSKKLNPQLKKLLDI